MVKTTTVLVGALIALLFWAVPVEAQLWAPVLAPSRGANWQAMPYSPPDTSTWTHCTGSPVSAADVANVPSIIANCDTTAGGRKVILQAGTFTTNLQWLVQNKSNLLIEGAGEFTGGTELVSSTTSNCAFGIAAICVVTGNPGNGWPSGMGGTNGAPDISNVIAGATRGSTQITVSLSDGARFQPGDQILVNQLNENNQTNYAPQINCFDGNALDCLGDKPRQITQHDVIVNSPSGVSCGASTCVLTLESPLYYPNWKQSLSPQIYTYASGVVGGKSFIRTPLKNVIIRHIKITPTWCPFNTCGSSALSYGAIQLYRTNGVLVEKVMVNGCDSGCVMSMESSNTTIRHSYFYNNRGAEAHNVSSEYGIVGNIATNLVAYNNILHKIQAPFTYNGWVNGSVIAYNYTRNQVAALCPVLPPQSCPTDSPWTFPYNWHSMWISHAGGMNTILLEGNDVNGVITEANEGNGCCYTFFRNRLSGREANNGFTNNYRYTTVFDLQIKSGRFTSVLGNVLGTAGYHNNYESSDAAHGRKGIIGQSGFGGESAIYRNAQRGGSGETTSPYPNYDTIVDQSLYRFGNWDSFTAATRWCGTSANTGWAANCGKGQSIGTPSTEVPSDQFVPSSESLPISFVFPAKPSWFGSIVWPPIGPDVTSGPASLGVANHANKIPARVCAESLGMLDDGTNGVLNFNADACYGTSGSDTTAPAAPTGVTIQ